MQGAPSPVRPDVAVRTVGRPAASIAQEVSHAEKSMYGIRNADGSGEELDDGHVREQLERVYDQLRSSCAEHGDVAITDSGTGWSLSAHRDERVVLENLLDT